MDIPKRIEVIREFKEKGGNIAAVFPIHYPRELLRAFNILPVEVWGPPRITTNLGAAHLQPYICTIVQNSLSYLLSGGLDVVDMLLVPHSCDSLQGLGSILIDFIQPRQPVLTLYIPRGERASDVDFLVNELRDVYNRLRDITGRSPSDNELMECVLREEAADLQLMELHRQRPLVDEILYRFIRSREYLPAETFIELVQQTMVESEDRNRSGIPILVSGIVPEPMNLFSALNQMGGYVVADDLACCGRRRYPPGKSEEPFRRMAERILSAAPDPMRGSPIKKRLEHLLNLAKASNARGVVFYVIKFCEPELFDIPQLRQELSQAGLPSLAIEVDINDQLAQPMLNRLAAFLEIIA